MGIDKSWMSLPRWHHEYIKGVDSFIAIAYSAAEEVCCPCIKCVFRYYHTKDIVKDHLIADGFIDGYDDWFFHGEGCELDTRNLDDGNDELMRDDIDGLLQDVYREVVEEVPNTEENRHGPSEDAKKFYKLVEEGQEELYPGCTRFSKLSFTIRMYIHKCVHGMSNEAFDDLLNLLKEAFPSAKLPDSFNQAKKVVKDLGLDYKKIHACPNDCMLYWKEHVDSSSCHVCGTSRWKTNGDNNEPNCSPKRTYQIPAKVLWHFPLKPRLQRLFMCSTTAKLMTWHHDKCPKDGNLRHPSDGEAWKTLDSLDASFSHDPRNVRLGLSSDGFNPFRTLSISHSTWPVVLINYNLPPWLSIKPEYLILSLLIPGPQSPGNDIDVYLQPLVEELKELWEPGVETYDASRNQTFQMRSVLLWTISDFPAYAMLSGWSTKGKYACPSCNYETSSEYMKYSRKFCYLASRMFLEESHPWRLDKKSFNGKVEVREAPTPLSGKEILELTAFETVFGKKQKKTTNSDKPWKKRSIFFQLPYWEHNPCRHCLDVMHIEKNICDNVLGTLLDIAGKTKDHAKARYDLKNMGIRKELQPFRSNDRQRTVFRAASFSMTDGEKRTFCSVLKHAKLPYACSSKTSRFVQDKKVSGYKSHDAHVLMQYLLQVAVRKTLPKHVAITLTRLGMFFKSICNKVIKVNDLGELQREIVEISCQLEKIFPPSFFDVMVHLPIHLVNQIRLGGPVHFHWMYWMERYLGRLKSYVRNRSHPEGSIAEGYLAEECLAFCSRYMHEGVKTRLNRYDVGHILEDQSEEPSHIFPKMGYPLGGKQKRKNGKKKRKGKAISLDEPTLMQAHRYVVFNCGDNDVENYITEHKNLIDSGRGSRWSKTQAHSQGFVDWFQARVSNEQVPDHISWLSKKPNPVAMRYIGYCSNGFKFYTRERDRKCKTQNSGVTLTAKTPSFASSRDQNPIIGDVEYYGAIDEIIEIDYWGAFSFVLFKCVWFDVVKDDYGLTCVNFNKLCYTDDPFVLASQVHQVFYVQDPSKEELHYVLQNVPRDLVEGCIPTNEEQYWAEAGSNIRVEVDSSIGDGEDVNWCRQDIMGDALEMPFDVDDLNREEIEDDID